MSVQDPAERIFTTVRTWILARLTARGVSVPVIARRQNAPAPKGSYLVVEYDTALGQVGRPSKGYRTATDFQSVVSDWAGALAIWEVGPSSATLASLMLDLDLQSSLLHFETAGLTLGIPGPITPMPDLDDSEFREQFRVEIPVSLALGQTDEALTYIETVELVYDI